jgi:putative ABC transport system substrate-binding protein
MNNNKYLSIDNTRRRLLIASAALPALAWTGAVCAQAKPPKVVRIGVLSLQSASNSMRQIDLLREGLRDLGYVEGKNLAIELRIADGKYERILVRATRAIE